MWQRFFEEDLITVLYGGQMAVGYDDSSGKYIFYNSVSHLSTLVCACVTAERSMSKTFFMSATSNAREVSINNDSGVP